jgi:hypothetical protein
MLDNDDQVDAIIEQLTDQADDRLLIAELDIGEEASKFAASDLGRYLIGRANQEIAEAHQLLTTCAWWNTRKIRRLQNNCKVAEMFKQYLLQAITSGRSALTELGKRHADAE